MDYWENIFIMIHDGSFKKFCDVRKAMISEGLERSRVLPRSRMLEIFNLIAGALGMTTIGGSANLNECQGLPHNRYSGRHLLITQSYCTNINNIYIYIYL